MLMFVFEYVLPLISFAMAIMLFVKFWSARNLLDKETIRMVKQVKTWWGRDQGVKSGASRANKKDYDSATKKVGSRIKEMIPFGLLNELNDAEVHAYIMHEDTVKFAIKLKELFGGDWKLPGMPQLPGTRRKDQDEVPSMSK
jgi:hypothetical protein